jgi:hypothetical protein
LDRFLRQNLSARVYWTDFYAKIPPAWASQKKILQKVAFLFNLELYFYQLLNSTLKISWGGGNV